MTHPPQDGEEPGPDDGAGTGSSSADPDRFPTEPAPTVPPGSPPPGYGQPPPQAWSPAYGPTPPYTAPEPGAAPYGGQPYGSQPYAGQPYAGQPYTGQPHGAPPYGSQPYAGQPYGTPPYGAPGQQFGPPPGPPQKSKVGLIAVLTAVVLVVIAGVVVLVMALQPTVLDAASAERDVAAQFEQLEGVAVELDCPDDMKVSAGATYTCTGKTAEGESVTLRLSITNPKTAAYTWTEP
jgi:hypothetical protein